jgi:hypothetical protein
LTNSCGSAASAIAQVEPVMPTQTPQNKFESPTVSPDQKSAYPALAQKPEKYEALDHT